MNESSKKVIIKYLIVALIGFLVVMIIGLFNGSGIINGFLMGIAGAMYAIGWFQSLILDRKKVGNLALLQQNFIMWIFYILLVLFILWAVGLIKAIYYIIKAVLA